MSCFICQPRKTNVVIAKSNEELLKEKLQQINKVSNVPLQMICITTFEGVLISSSLDDSNISIDFITTLASLKLASCRFTKLFSLTGCQRLKVTGENSIFYLYCLDEDYLLAFFSQSDNEINDFIMLNDNLIIPIIEEITILIRKLPPLIPLIS